jgi:hypothetical protein|tara:strand:+ start:2434 stop:2694 length:261 start_codon:yes stop_codon:yes gene_type:complete
LGQQLTEASFAPFPVDRTNPRIIPIRGPKNPTKSTSENPAPDDVNNIRKIYFGSTTPSKFCLMFNPTMYAVIRLTMAVRANKMIKR